MKAHVAIAIAAAVLGLGATDASAADRARESYELLVKTGEAYDAKDCVGVLKLARPIADTPDAGALPDEQAAVLYALVVSCELQADDAETAYRYAMVATARPTATDDVWRWRLGLELQTRRDAAAVATVEALAEHRLQLLNAYPAAGLGQLSARVFIAKDRPLRRRLLAVLGGGSYQPTELFIDTDTYTSALAGMLAEDGDRAGAEALARQLREPGSLIDASLDPRLAFAFPTDPDIRAAVESRLGQDQAVAEAHPELLAGPLAIADDLRGLGRLEEALDVLAKAEARMKDPKAFTDLDAKLNWFWDSRARGQAMLGRYQQAVDSFKRGSEHSEYGLNVSQVINLAALHIRFGHPQAALDELKAFDDPKRRLSPYGDMQLRLQRLCALALSGRMAETGPLVAYGREHERAAPSAYLEMLFCTHDLNTAAAELIHQLDDPELRVGVLARLSTYDPYPASVPPDPEEQGLSEIAQRPDVKAAIQKAGRPRRFNVMRDAI